MMSRGVQVALQQQAHGRARPAALVALLHRFGRRAGTVGQAHAQGFDGAGHGVGRVHAAARARPGAAVADDQLALFLADGPGQGLPVALEGGDDVQLGVLGGAAGADRAAVDHQRRPVQPAHGDQAAGHVLVAAGNGHQGVVPVGGHGRLDGVGDDFPRLQRVTHALRAHADAVADADSVEAHAHQAGVGHVFFDPGRQFVEVHVAGVALVPHGGDAHLRPVHVLFAQARAEEHGLRRALGLGLGDSGAVFVEGGGCHGVDLGAPVAPGDYWK